MTGRAQSALIAQYARIRVHLSVLFGSNRRVRSMQLIDTLACLLLPSNSSADRGPVSGTSHSFGRHHIYQSTRMPSSTSAPHAMPNPRAVAVRRKSFFRTTPTFNDTQLNQAESIHRHLSRATAEALWWAAIDLYVRSRLRARSLFSSTSAKPVEARQEPSRRFATRPLLACIRGPPDSADHSAPAALPFALRGPTRRGYVACPGLALHSRRRGRATV